MTQEVKILGGIGLVTLALLIGAVFFLSKPSVPSTPEAKADLLVKDDSNKIATSSAKVTIVEFGDYQCPACAAANPTKEKILKDYQGKINFVFRHFPLSQHQNAMIAAEAAESAGEQGQYWQMHNALYMSQKQWSESSNPTEIFVSFAEKLGLDTEKFTNSITKHKFQDKIISDKNDGTSLGINSTPTFYVNGVKLRSFNYTDFKTAIDQAGK